MLSSGYKIDITQTLPQKNPNTCIRFCCYFWQDTQLSPAGCAQHHI